MEPIRVFIADDHAVLREGLATLIEAQGDMVVVGQGGNGQEAIAGARDLTPDVMLIDLTMPGMTGIEAISALLVESPKTRVLVLSMHDDPTYVRAAVAAGARGYVVKHAAGKQLVSAIREVHAGRSFINVTISEEALQTLIGEANVEPTRTRLTPREREVLIFVAQGFTHKEIGERLKISKKSVDSYRTRVAEKLGLRNRAELVRYALRAGLLRSDSGSD